MSDTCPSCGHPATSNGQPSKRQFYSCGSYGYEPGTLSDRTDLCQAWADIAELTAERDALQAWAGPEMFRSDYRTASDMRAALDRAEASKSAEFEAHRMTQCERDAALAKLATAREALGSIEEYWNRDTNERAMQDACEHAIATASAALTATAS